MMHSPRRYIPPLVLVRLRWELLDRADIVGLEALAFMVVCYLVVPLMVLALT